MHAHIHTLMMTSYWFVALSALGHFDKGEIVVSCHFDHQQARWIRCLDKDTTTETGEVGIEPAAHRLQAKLLLSSPQLSAIS